LQFHILIKFHLYYLSLIFLKKFIGLNFQTGVYNIYKGEFKKKCNRDEIVGKKREKMFEIGLLKSQVLNEKRWRS